MSFVGRHAERRQVCELLATRASAPFVVHVSGMPGIGKSELLAQLAADAADIGYAVWTAPRDLPAAQRAQQLHEHLAAVSTRTLVVADDWPALGLWEAALVERIEHAHGPLAVVIGSRLRPGAALLDSALFPGRLFPIELGGLDPEAAVAMLGARGLSSGDALELHRVTSGQPFAMLLLSTAPTLWAPPHAPGDRVTEVLVRRIVDQIGDPEAREALDLLALVGVLNERELRVILGLEAADARRTFDRLCELTVVRRDPRGLLLHPIVRSLLVADLQLRDPVRARDLVGAAVDPIEEGLGWSGRPHDRALAQLRDLVGAAPQDVAMSGMFQLDTATVAQPLVRDLDEVLGLIEALEGRTSRAIAARWAAHDPSSVTVVRSRDRIDGVMIRMELRGTTVPDALSEPAVDRLVEALTASGQLEPGLLLRTTRFYTARGHHQMPCAELAALGAAITARTLETYEPFWSVQHMERRAVDAWREIIATLGFVVRTDAAVEIDGRTIVPCVGDVTDQGALFSGVARRAWGLAPRPVPLPSAQTPASPVDDGVLEDDVTDALRHMRDLVWLQTAPLGQYLFGALPLPDRARRLKDWLESTVDATENMHHGDLVAKALRACFGSNRTPEEAASQAGMALSTLKRHRKRGIVHIAALAQQARGR